MDKLAQYLSKNGVVELFDVRDRVSALAEIGYKAGIKGGINGVIDFLEQVSQKAKKREDNLKYRHKKSGEEVRQKGKKQKKNNPAVDQQEHKTAGEINYYAGIDGHIDSADILRPVPPSVPSRGAEEQHIAATPMTEKEESKESIAKGGDLEWARNEAKRLLGQIKKNKEAPKKELARNDKAEMILHSIVAKKMENDKKKAQARASGVGKQKIEIEEFKTSLISAKTRKEIGESATKKMLAEEFDEFWRAYPRRIAKMKAEQAYAKAREKAAFKEIIDGIEVYMKEKPDYADWAHPATWLNQGRWGDEYTNAAGGKESTKIVLTPEQQYRSKIRTANLCYNLSLNAREIAREYGRTVEQVLKDGAEDKKNPWSFKK